ncbi:hypothetical protein [Brevundimonas sp.]|uniref:hypothetical protein n=1 Tax=Brevundimonas sp. TaxID=1871086 RepID=UPI001A2536DC|nr:hypothetical protein [Brevundimonas sp.]MBJ7483747.1 hypothetical protein [Brevundimonas sp.]
MPDFRKGKAPFNLANLTCQTRFGGGPAPLLALKGLVFDCDGVSMTRAHAYGKSGAAHRYYVSSSVNRGRGERRPDGIYRLPALPVERWVIETLHRLAPDHDPLAVLSRIEVHEHTVQLALNGTVLSPEARGLPVTMDRLRRALVESEQVQVEGERLWVHIPSRLKFRGGKAWLSGEAPKRSRMSQALIKALKRSHHLVASGSDAECVLQQAPSSPHERDLIRLAFLAPDLQAAILDGRQDAGLCLEDLRGADFPLCWDDQRRSLRV